MNLCAVEILFVKILMRLGTLHFLEILNDKTYEWEPIRKFHSITSKIFMNKEGKSSNNFVCFGGYYSSWEHEFEISLFHPPQTHDYIYPSCSHDLLLNYGVSARSNLLLMRVRN